MANKLTPHQVDRLHEIGLFVRYYHAALGRLYVEAVTVLGDEDLAADLIYNNVSPDTVAKDYQRKEDYG